MIPLAYVFGFVCEMGIIGIMLAVVIAVLECAVVIFIRYVYVMRRINKKQK